MAERRGRDVLILAVCAALTVTLLLLSFAPVQCRFLCWIALTPLLVALCRGAGWRGLLILWLAGQVFGTLGFIWMRHVTWLGTFLLGFYVSLYFVLFCVLVRWLRCRRGVPFAISAAVVWAGLEHFRGVFLGGLPWLFLSRTQYCALTVIQIADLTGEPGVTFWVVAVSGLLADAACRLLGRGPAMSRGRLIAAAAAVLALSIGAQTYGVWRLNTLETRTGPRIAVLQGNIPQEVKNLMTEESLDDMFRKYLVLSGRALAAPNPPDLVVWPETMARPFILDPRNDVPGNIWLTELERLQWRANLVVGANSAPTDDPEVIYNSVFFLPRRGRGATQRYDKIHLVPFGEFVPLKSVIGWLIGPFIPYKTGLMHGSRHVLFEVGGWRFAPTICFEDAFAELVADFGRGPDKMDFILNVTNEGWFKDGAELDEHLAVGVFRAVECRAGLVRAANTGISAFIEPTGRIVSKLVVDGRDREVEGVLEGVATGAVGRSPFLLVGNLFGNFCAALCGLAIAMWAWAGIAARRTRHAPPQKPVKSGLS